MVRFAWLVDMSRGDTTTSLMVCDLGRLTRGRAWLPWLCQWVKQEPLCFTLESVYVCETHLGTPFGTLVLQYICNALHV
jgi:hypothetical protein